MAREPMIQPPPPQVWLTHRQGVYAMARTSDKDGESIRYVLGRDYDELLAWAEQHMVDGRPCRCAPALNEPFGDSEQLPPSPTPPDPDPQEVPDGGDL